MKVENVNATCYNMNQQSARDSAIQIITKTNFMIKTTTK